VAVCAGGRPSKKVENVPPLETGKTRDIAAKKAGFHNARTYEQAKDVVKAAKVSLSTPSQ
jgi:hypothetical protein